MKINPKLTAPALLVLASIGYLLLEAAFNATLLDVASDPGVSRRAIHNVELLGRTVSGIGFALLVIGLGLKRKWRALWLLGILAWAFMFWGQRFAIDKLLIEPTTWEARQKAQYMAYLKSAVSHGLVEIDGVPLTSGTPDEPDEKTLMALLGSVAMQNSGFLDELKKKTPDILKRTITAQGNEFLKGHYDRYLQVSKEVKSAWESYRKASAKYDKAQNHSWEMAAKMWAETYQKVRTEGWKDYQDAVWRAKNKAGRGADRGITKLIAWFADEYPRCGHNGCRKITRAIFKRKIKKATGRDIPPETFCYKQKKKAIGKFFDTLGAVLSVMENSRWDGPTTTYRCPGDREAAVRGLMIAYADDFKKQSGGYSPFIKTADEFMQHPATAGLIAKKAKARGVRLPAGWKITDHQAFKVAASAAIRKKAEEDWNHRTHRLLGQSIPPKLSYYRFVHHKAVQQFLHNKLGDYYVNNISPDWDIKTFRDKVVYPVGRKLLARRVKELKEDGVLLGENERKEDEGRDYIRAAIVPPVALFFSLFFGLLTAVKLVYAGIVGSASAVAPMNRWAKLSIGLGLLALVLALPLAIKGKYTDNKAVATLVASAKQGEYPWLGWFADYTLRIEPVVYPIGNRVLVIAGFKDDTIENNTSQDEKHE